MRPGRRATNGSPFQLVSCRYERASSIATSNKDFARWGEIFGDNTVAAAMIDRLIHHAEVIAPKGASSRLKNRELGRVPAPSPKRTSNRGRQFSIAAKGDSFQPPLTFGSSRCCPGVLQPKTEARRASTAHHGPRLEATCPAMTVGRLPGRGASSRRPCSAGAEIPRIPPRATTAICHRPV